MNEFRKYATSNCGISGTTVDKYVKKNGLYMPSSSYVNPTIIEERQLNVAQMDVFSRLMMDRIIFIGSEINDDVANIINGQLLFLNSLDNESEITIYLNTPGGSVHDGLAIYDTMQYISNPISTVCIGMAASMGSILLSSGDKGKRFALPHSRIMIHQPMGGMRGQASDMEIECKEIIKLKNELYQILSDNSGQTFEQIAADCDRDHWFTAEEAKEYGLIDDIFRKNNA